MIYTKHGDDGTSMLGGERLSKSDIRFSLLGDIDELNSYLGLITAKLGDSVGGGEKQLLQALQEDLLLFAADIYDSASSKAVNRVENNSDFLSRFESAVFELEQRIDYMQGVCRTTGFIRPGGCELSALIDICRCIARRLERGLCAAKNLAAPEALKYFNRLSDYLFALARHIDFLDEIESTVKHTLAKQNDFRESIGNSHEINTGNCREASIKIEDYAKKMSLGIAIAFCDASGKPVFACAAKEALIISFDCALRKAYTAAALRMPTVRVQELVSPGGIFYGLTDPRLLPIPGGVPIKSGKIIIGGLGISGGDDKQDTEIAEYGAELFGNGV